MTTQQILSNPPKSFIQSLIAQGKIKVEKPIETAADRERAERTETLRKIDKALFMQRLRAERRGQSTGCFPARVRI
jgi:hypothetical protein